MFITPICKLRKFAESKTYVWIGMAACKVIKHFQIQVLHWMEGANFSIL
jgi:hypothetical protein